MIGILEGTSSSIVFVLSELINEKSQISSIFSHLMLLDFFPIPFQVLESF
jgi:hypothetical protein